MAAKSGPQSKAAEPAVVRDPPTRRSAAFDLFGNPNPFLQAKLTVNPPSHRFEREADRVAEAVVQESSRGWREVASFKPAVAENAGVWRDAETIGVRGKASARAFTFRRDLYSGGGQYDPRSYSGAKLLAHEPAAFSGALAAGIIYPKPLQSHGRPMPARAAPARAVSRSEAAAATPSPMHRLQRTIGNPGVGRLLAARQVIQPRLKVGPVDDPLEREADRVADQVMRMPAPQLQRACCASCAAGGPCTDELQCEPIRNDPVPPQGGMVDAGLLAGLGSGKPLPPAERAFFEPRFGADLSHVRIHDSPGADRATRSLEARAFTYGRDIAFVRGAYRPGTAPGRRLLAHELVHVLQQGATGGETRRANTATVYRAADENAVEATSDPLNRLADVVADQLATTGELDARQAAAIGEAALRTVGYEGLLGLARRAGMVQRGPVRPRGGGTDAGSGTMVRRQAASTFGQVFTRYAVAAGVASQVDSPAPGPGDVVALGILAVGLVAATAAAVRTRRTARRQRWSCEAQCNVQEIRPGANCPERVFGFGTGPDQESACRAAKRAATQSTPPGCYPRHCRCFNCTRG